MNKRNKGKEYETIFSYGGGVQSFAMLLAIKNGLIERPSVIASVDMSPYEPATKKHIAEIAKPIVDEMGIRWVTLDGSMLREKLMQGIPMTPYWHDKGLNPQRLCTIRFKIDAVDDLIMPQAWVKVLLGISTDEIKRAKWEDQRLSHGRMKTKVYPLLELGWSRDDCMQYIVDCGYDVPPKSACYLCPFSSKQRVIENLASIPEMYDEVKLIESRWRERGSYDRYLTLFRDALPTTKEASQMLIVTTPEYDNSGACGVCEF